MAEGKQVLSFGCRLNIYESEVIKGHLPEGSNTLVEPIATRARDET